MTPVRRRAQEEPQTANAGGKPRGKSAADSQTHSATAEAKGPCRSSRGGASARQGANVPVPKP
eukprot:10421964-Alexandrium_andersonii.AAC.1